MSILLSLLLVALFIKIARELSDADEDTDDVNDDVDDDDGGWENAEATTHCLNSSSRVPPLPALLSDNARRRSPI